MPKNYFECFQTLYMPKSTQQSLCLQKCFHQTISYWEFEDWRWRAIIVELDEAAPYELPYQDQRCLQI